MIHELAGKFLVAYLRVSSDKQDVARQRMAIEEWAERNGLKISFWFEDSEGKNPRDLADKRPEFQRLLKFIEAGSVDFVVVDSRDRFGTKDSYEFGKYIVLLRQHGCSLWSIMEGNLSSDDDATVLTNAVGSLTSKREQIEKGKRSLEGKVLRARDGEYPGGYPPHGLDVVCFDAAGNAKWRLVWVGHFRRIKILNDGTEQEYVGKNNVPAKDRTEKLRYRPSIKTERMDVVRQIFDWYDTELISPSQIATRLNEAGVDPVFGEGWNKQKIKQIIRNPIYIGYPAFNKRGGGRFVEYVDGEFRRVESKKGAIVAGRPRKASDFVRSSQQEFDPIVSPELFERCNQKMDANSDEYKMKVPTPRSPKTASFWLRNIVVCAGCNRPMRAWNAMPNSANPYRSYFCANYGTYGRRNPSGCHANRVKAELLEQIVEIYLNETHQQIAELLKLDKGEDDGIVLSMESETEQKREEFRRINRTMMEFIGSYGNEGETAIDVVNRIESDLMIINEDGSTSMVGDRQVYEHLYAKMKPELKRAVSKLDKEHSKQIERLARLPKTAVLAVEKEEARLLKIENQLTQARGRLDNLSIRSASIMAELQERYRCIENARASIHDDTAFRRKTALVSQVIERIVCHFKATGGTGKQPRTKLESVEIVPRIGDRRRFYPDGIMQEKD